MIAPFQGFDRLISCRVGTLPQPRFIRPRWGALTPLTRLPTPIDSLLPFPYILWDVQLTKLSQERKIRNMKYFVVTLAILQKTGMPK